MYDSDVMFTGQNKRARLLIVDDQPVNVKALNEIFKDEYDVLVATNGQQAIKIAREQRPDLILLDIVMPDVDGYTVCRTLKSLPDMVGIPIIFVTSNDDESNEVQGFEIGGADYISKPVNPVIVKARVKTHITLKKQVDLLETLANQDGLTGVANRRKFNEMLSYHFRACMRESQPLSMVMIDVDFFKRYNDYYGHVAGDMCLQQIANAISVTIRRPWDLLCRYGGEEFACLLPFTSAEHAAIRARAMLDAIHHLNIPHHLTEASDRVSVSIGVACLIPTRENTEKQLITEADRALYQSKSEGRARVTIFNPQNP